MKSRIQYRAINCPEPLESRTMLAGNGFLPFSHLAHRFAESAGPQQSATQIVSSAIAGNVASHGRTLAALGSRLADSSQTLLTATLTDASGSATGAATYTTSTSGGVTETTFSASIRGADANTTYDVAIGDTVVGQITTDDTGAGKLVLSSNATDSAQSLPADFPMNIGADTEVTIGSLRGTLASDTDTGEGGEGRCHGSHHASSLTTSLTDSTSTATGTATYQTNEEDGTTTFSVSVTGAVASSTLDIGIDGTVIGQLTTDSTGTGSAAFSSNPTGTQQALPSNFPTSMSSGSTVTVGTLSGTLASSNNSTSSESFFGAHHLARRR